MGFELDCVIYILRRVRIFLFVTMSILVSCPIDSGEKLARVADHWTTSNAQNAWNLVFMV